MSVIWCCIVIRDPLPRFHNKETKNSDVAMCSRMSLCSWSLYRAAVCDDRKGILDYAPVRLRRTFACELISSHRTVRRLIGPCSQLSSQPIDFNSHGFDRIRKIKGFPNRFSFVRLFKQVGKLDDQWTIYGRSMRSMRSSCGRETISANIRLRTAANIFLMFATRSFLDCQLYPAQSDRGITGHKPRSNPWPFVHVTSSHHHPQRQKMAQTCSRDIQLKTFTFHTYL